jgi:hypothetical protein
MRKSSLQIVRNAPPILTGLVVLLCAALLAAQTTRTRPKIYAQQLVSETLAAHPELTGVELAATPPGKSQCVTIASTESKGIGEKCDKDEFTAMKTNKPFVEKEKEGGKEVYDVTIPIHDSTGKIIATAGLDFKPEPNQTNDQITQGSLRIAKELEAKLGSKDKLFEPAT